MPTAALRPDEANALSGAAQLLNAGRAQEAAAKVGPLIANGLRHPDVLMVYSAACERLGKMRDALAACQAALEAAPENADMESASQTSARRSGSLSGATANKASRFYRG